MSETKRGFFARVYKNHGFGIGASVMYSTPFQEFCIWIQIAALSIYVGYNFSTKEESK
jgi:hypothetical protein